MKNFLFILVSIIITSSVFYGGVFAWDCITEVNADTDISIALKDCLSDTSVVPVKTDVDLAGGFQTVIIWWVNNIAILLGILAVWSIVFGSLLLTLSTWEDEKIKKAKDVIKWGILGFLWVVTASTIITVVVKIMYSI